MNTHSHPVDLARDPAACRAAIIEALGEGNLSLFLGAGVSLSSGRFLGWSSLVKACCENVGVSFDDTQAEDNEYLLLAGDRFKKKCLHEGGDFRERIEDCLYQNRQSYDKTFMKLDLLIAIGALVMNSVRGRANCVVNYNYDDVLEWYLMYHGFLVSIVAQYPELLGKHDIAIYHPHGFLPLMAAFRRHRSAPEQVVISKDDYQEAISESSPWNDFQKGQFGSTVALFVGMSGDDEHIQVLFRHAYKKLVKYKRVIGFMLLEDTPKSHKREEENRDRGIIHVYYPNHDALPDYLLEICRDAVVR